MVPARRAVMRNRGALVFGALLALVVILIDQLTKLWVFNNFVPGESISVTPFLNLVLVFNPGAAFSFLADHTGWQHQHSFESFAAPQVLFRPAPLQRQIHHGAATDHAGSAHWPLVRQWCDPVVDL